MITYHFYTYSNLCIESYKYAADVFLKTVPIVWRVLPTLGGIINKWNLFAENKEYKILYYTIKNGVKTLGKYFNLVQMSPAHIVNICMFSSCWLVVYTDICLKILTLLQRIHI